MSLPDKPIRSKRKFWIQRADFSSEDFDPVELKIASAIVAGYDWASELLLFDELLNESDNHWDEVSCPGIGFHNEDEAHLLHVCPQPDQTALCFYLPSDGERWSLADAELAQINQLLKLFFDEDYTSLMAFMQKAPPVSDF